MYKQIKTKLTDTLLLGIGIWLIGYVSSIILYGFLPKALLGWILFIIFTPIVSYIAYSRFKARKGTLNYYLLIGFVWLIVAVVFDYLFIVKLFGSENYYGLDVFVYYAVTFLIPVLVGSKYGRS